MPSTGGRRLRVGLIFVAALLAFQVITPQLWLWGDSAVVVTNQLDETMTVEGRFGGGSGGGPYTAATEIAPGETVIFVHSGSHSYGVFWDGGWSVDQEQLPFGDASVYMNPPTDSDGGGLNESSPTYLLLTDLLFGRIVEAKLSQSDVAQ